MFPELCVSYNSCVVHTSFMIVHAHEMNTVCIACGLAAVDSYGTWYACTVLQAATEQKRAEAA